MESRGGEWIQGWLVGRLAELGGLPAAAVDPGESLAVHGVDSRAVIGLAAELGGALGRAISPLLFWDHPSPAELAAHLAEPAGAEASGSRPCDLMPSDDEPIAVIGMACRFPGAPDVGAYWRLLRDGVDATTTVPRDRWDADSLHDEDPAAPGKTSSRRGGFLPEVDRFDPSFFGISPREAAQMDPQQRLMLELSWEALEDAGVPSPVVKGSPTGVFFGVMWSDYATLLQREGKEAIAAHTVAGSHHAFVANRVSYALGLRGPSLALDSGCSSALVAAHLACESLRRGESSLALVGGVNLILAPESTIGVTKFGALSPDGRCRTFDAQADGYARGEGGGVVVLKPLARALADGDHIHCVIRGSAVINNGAGSGLTAPSAEAQEELLRLAYARAGVAPHAVAFVEAHGTGTLLGDPIEARALGRVLGAGRSVEQSLAIGSHKTNIGHLEAAAGIAGLIKVALSLSHRAIPASLNFDEPNPHIPFAEWRLRVQATLGDLSSHEGPIVAGVSAFGLGGTNSHVVVEEASQPRAELHAELRSRAARFLDGQAGAGIFAGCAESGDVRPVFAFPGLGSHWAQMGQSLLREPVYRATIERCDARMQAEVGLSLFAELSAPRARSRLDRVDVACPATVALEIALARLLMAWGIEPVAVVGHSVGEIAAAHVAGALDLDDAMRLACHVGRLTARIRERGAMALVGLGWDDAAAALVGREDRLFRAIEEGPQATVLGGDPAALAAALRELEARGVFCRKVDMEGAPHTPVVAEVRAELEAVLAGLVAMPERTPIVSAATGRPVAGTDLDAGYWGRWFVEPARFAGAVGHLAAEGRALFLEVGPHPTLRRAIDAGLAASGRRAVVLSSLRRGEDGRATLLDATGALFALGHPGISEAAPSAPHVLPLSARTPEALEALRREYLGFLRTTTASVADVAYSASVRRTHLGRRLAVVGSSRAELLAALERAPVGSGAQPRSRRGVVLVFSGQGSQWAGMGRELEAEEPVFSRALAEVAAIHARCASFSLLAAVRGDPGARSLADTDVAQPAIFAIQIALARLLASWGVEPAAVIGHSVGELAAACVAGALTLEEATLAVHRRGRLVHEAPSRGKMLAAEMPEGAAAHVAREHGLALAAVNDPGSIVLSGDGAAIDATAVQLLARGVACRKLPVAYAFHHPAKAPAAGDLLTALSGLRPRAAAVPFYSTVTGALAAGSDLDAAYWARNVRDPVRFEAAVSAAISDGHRTFVEVGPHAVLAAHLARGLDERRERGVVVPTMRRGADGRRALRDTVARLYVAGAAIEWRSLHPAGGVQVALPSYPWERQRCWFEPRGSRASLPESGLHPVLGRPFTIATQPGARFWERGLATPVHDLAGEVARLASALAAEVLGTGEHRIEGLSLEQPPRGGACVLQIAAFPEGPDAVGFQIASQAPGELSWARHATGRVRRARPDLAEPDWFHAVEWRRATDAPVRSTPPPVAAGPWVLLIDRGGTGGALAAALRARGEPCVLVGAGERFADACAGQPPPRGVVYLASLDAAPAERTSPEVLGADLTAGALGVLAAARAILEQGYRDPPRLWLVTRGAQSVGPGYEPVALAQAPLWGLRRVLAAEHPELESACIDLGPDGAADVEALAREFVTQGPEDQVALRGGARYLARLATARPSGPVAAIRADATYLVTGGLRGLGLSLCQWLVGEGARHLTLAARTPPAAATIAALERGGARVTVVRADVADPESLRALVQDLARRGPSLRGVFHLAAVVEDRTLVGLEAAALRRVLAPKALGAWNLHLATLDQPLDLFVLYSSAATLVGSPGQGSYAAANAFLDALAHHRRALGLPACSIAWGPFSEVGLAAADGARGERLARRGMGTITPAQGVRALGYLLRGAPAHVAVMPFAAREWLDFYPGAARSPYWSELLDARVAARLPGSESFRERVERAEPADRRRLVEERLTEEAARVIGLPASRIDRLAPFGEIGVDSLISLEIRSRLESVVGVPLSSTLVFSYPTVAALAGHVLRLFGASDEPAAPDRLSSEVARMSEAEAEAALLESLRAVGQRRAGR